MGASDTTPGRRSFLLKSLALVPASFAAGAPQATAAAIPYSPRFLTPDESRFLEAACARLIPSDALGPGAVETGILEFLDRQLDGSFGHASRWYMQGPFATGPAEMGYQSPMTPRQVYRAGIAALDADCLKAHGKAFADLAPETQDALLSRVEKGAIELEGVGAKAFFEFLLQNTREGFLADPIHGGNRGMASWKMIGFPGARADYLDWIDRPNERYTLPPVGIGGSEA